MGWSIRSLFGGKASSPPKDKNPSAKSQEDDTQPRTFTVTVFCGEARSGNQVDVTTNSRFGKSDLATILEKPIRAAISNIDPAMWDFVLQANRERIEAELQERHPGAHLTIQSLSVRLASAS